MALTVWIQWQKPLYPFSLWGLAKPATELSDLQRRVLSVLRRRINGWYTGAWVAVVTGVFLYVVFRQIYISAPLAADIAPFPPVLRLIGILWAEVFFLIGNLLLQMGVAAARVMFVPASEFNSLKPYEIDLIRKDFTILGMRSPHLLAFATEPLEPIQQTAELITDQPEPAQLPAAGTKQTITDRIKPLLAQLSGVSDTLSGLLNKVSTLLPGKSPSKSPTPTATPANSVVPTPPEPVVDTDSTEVKQPSAPATSVSDEVSSPSVETAPTEIVAEAVEAKAENDETVVGEDTIETPPAFLSMKL
ncbi:MAG: low-complexity tail membrane protein, partial [Pseudanabaena sp. RU_4_16]|nr:low-complexity tail membrane protein [Pseudanabaena sp. RU_4_16]